MECLHGQSNTYESFDGHKEVITIIFKYGGSWIQTNDQHRKRYDGGKRRSSKFKKGELTIFALKGEIDRICPWLKGHPYSIHYHLHGTSPKVYKVISSNSEMGEFVGICNDVMRAEIVITIQELQGQDLHFALREVVCTEQVDEISMKTNELDVGACFPDAASFKHTLRSVAIRKNYGVKIKASDRKRVIATCSFQGCQWRIRASLCEDMHTFQIRRVDGCHTCPGINRAGNRLATSAWVANEVKEIVKRNPEISPKDININLEKEHGLSLPYMKLWRSREQARDYLFGSIEDNYKWVPTLQAELSCRNPGSHITYSYDNRDNSFQRFYVCLKVCSDGFINGCRPLISLDACHLKSKHLGMLLSATSLDGNNGLFPLAFAVVENESKNTWSWFLHNLEVSISSDLAPLSFISDMEKGLGDAIREVYPIAEHRVCIRHLWKNMKKNHCYRHFHHHNQQVKLSRIPCIGRLKLIQCDVTCFFLLIHPLKVVAISLCSIVNTPVELSSTVWPLMAAVHNTFFVTVA